MPQRHRAVMLTRDQRRPRRLLRTARPAMRRHSTPPRRHIRQITPARQRRVQQLLYRRVLPIPHRPPVIPPSDRRTLLPAPAARRHAAIPNFIPALLRSTLHTPLRRSRGPRLRRNIPPKLLRGTQPRRSTLPKLLRSRGTRRRRSIRLKLVRAHRRAEASLTENRRATKRSTY